MKKFLLIISLSILCAVLATPVFSSDDKHENQYKAHFPDIDLDGDDQVNWKEFSTYFKHAQEDIFKKADTNKNGSLDHDEWHEFKEKQGYTHD